MATKKKKSEESEISYSLSTLRPPKGSRQKRKRLGIGEGSGLGKTCGKGTKGQKSRSGYSRKAGFEGGQMPLYRRLPKFGFTSRARVREENIYRVVNVGEIEAIGMDHVTVEALEKAGLISSRKIRVKLLGGGELKRKLTVEVHACSQSARAAVEKAGGEIRLVEGKTL